MGKLLGRLHQPSGHVTTAQFDLSNSVRHAMTFRDVLRPDERND